MDDLSAAELISRRLWLLTQQHGGPLPQAGVWKHVQCVFDPAWLALLGLPLESQGESRQTVALVDGHEFSRLKVGAEVAEAYGNRPRTQLYESVGARSGGWFAATDLLLTRLFRYEVTSDIYVSNAGDANIGAHRDEWYGMIIQLAGAKQWKLWSAGNRATTLLLEAGDVLLLPNDVWHDISTPNHSVHVVFAAMIHEPIAELLAEH